MNNRVGKKSPPSFNAIGGKEEGLGQSASGSGLARCSPQVKRRERGEWAGSVGRRGADWWRAGRGRGRGSLRAAAASGVREGPGSCAKVLGAAGSGPGLWEKA